MPCLAIQRRLPAGLDGEALLSFATGFHVSPKYSRSTVLVFVVLVGLGCSGSGARGTPASAAAAACNAASVSHHLGDYVEDTGATVAHLKASYMGRAGMSADEIEGQVTKAVRVRVTASSVDFEGRYCCAERVISDTDAVLELDVSCPPKGKYRYTFRSRADGKLLFVSDSQPGRPPTPDSPGFEALRYEEHVLTPSGSR
jgi:hypothetical protein